MLGLTEDVNDKNVADLELFSGLLTNLTVLSQVPTEAGNFSDSHQKRYHQCSEHEWSSFTKRDLPHGAFRVQKRFFGLSHYLSNHLCQKQFVFRLFSPSMGLFRCIFSGSCRPSSLKYKVMNSLEACLGENL